MKHKWLNIVRNRTEVKTVDVTIRGEIVSDTWYDGAFSPADLDEIVGIDADYINVYLNTIGGEVYAGIEICSILKRHKAIVRVVNTGFTASIGTVIMSAGDEKGMVKNGVYMVHDPICGMYGNARELRKVADDMDAVKTAMLNSFDYNKKLSLEEISQLMTEETFMTAQEALDNGFIDYIVDEEVEIINNKTNLAVNGVKIDKKKYKNLKTDKLEAKTIKNGEKDQKSINYTLFEQAIAENQLNINTMEVL